MATQIQQGEIARKSFRAFKSLKFVGNAVEFQSEIARGILMYAIAVRNKQSGAPALCEFSPSREKFFSI